MNKVQLNQAQLSPLLEISNAMPCMKVPVTYVLFDEESATQPSAIVTSGTNFFNDYLKHEKQALLSLLFSQVLQTSSMIPSSHEQQAYRSRTNKNHFDRFAPNLIRRFHVDMLIGFSANELLDGLKSTATSDSGSFTIHAQQSYDLHATCTTICSISSKKCAAY